MVARISRPAKTAMQSGQAKSRRWLLEYEPAAGKTVDPLMGWTSTTDAQAQIRLWFGSKEDAVAYCERKGIAYQVIEPKASAHRQVAVGAASGLAAPLQRPIRDATSATGIHTITRSSVPPAGDRTGARRSATMPSADKALRHLLK